MLLAFAHRSEGVISQPRTFTGRARGLAWFTNMLPPRNLLSTIRMKTLSPVAEPAYGV
jgi:hypothetical protein